MRCPEAFSVRIAARDTDRQSAEIHIRIALMNRVIALGAADIILVARPQCRKGHSYRKLECRKNADLAVPGPSIAADAATS